MKRREYIINSAIILDQPVYQMLGAAGSREMYVHWKVLPASQTK